ncbi:Uncharacterised protein [uncultured Roseburia sp.]|nr:Uncharacterised protein [uncultured Roseburia sp.]
METVVLLSHKKPDSHINVKVEFGEGEGKVPLDNIAKKAVAYKPKERVTYKMIKEYIEAKYGFKVHTAYIAEVKRDLGLPMYDAPNAVEELKQPKKHPTAEKVEAIKDALKHFEIIESWQKGLENEYRYNIIYNYQHTRIFSYNVSVVYIRLSTNARQKEVYF